MTQALVDDSQAERLAVDLAQSERQLAQAEMKAHEAEKRALAAERETAGYLAVIHNLEVAIEALKERRLQDKQIIRNLRTIIRLRQSAHYPEFTGDPTGRKVLIIRAADSLSDEFVGRLGIVTAVRRITTHYMVLTVQFPDGRVSKFPLTEVELNQALIATLEAEAS